MQAICRKYDILVVADEVINGFGRIGTLFACERFGIDPDILVLSKQITSSYLPLSAVLFSRRDLPGDRRQHGQDRHLRPRLHRRAAIRSPRRSRSRTSAIIEERGLVEHAAADGRGACRASCAAFADHPLVGEVRGVGLIAAVELVADKETKAQFDPLGRVGAQVFSRAHENGLIVRAIGDVIAFCPPLIITEDQVRDMVERFRITLDETAAWLREADAATP